MIATSYQPDRFLFVNFGTTPLAPAADWREKEE
jgi:hypothetical protein